MLRWRKPTSNRVKAGSIAGHLDGVGPYKRLTIRVDGRLYLAHRVAWLIANGQWPSRELDHANGDALDNRLENLREATRAENARNVPARKRNRVGLKGVCWDRSKGKWLASAKHNGRNVYLGRFNTPEEAHAAWRDFATKNHGDFLRVS